MKFRFEILNLHFDKLRLFSIDSDSVRFFSTDKQHALRPILIWSWLLVNHS